MRLILRRFAYVFLALALIAFVMALASPYHFHEISIGGCLIIGAILYIITIPPNEL